MVCQISESWNLCFTRNAINQIQNKTYQIKRIPQNRFHIPGIYSQRTVGSISINCHRPFKNVATMEPQDPVIAVCQPLIKAATSTPSVIQDRRHYYCHLLLGMLKRCACQSSLYLCLICSKKCCPHHRLSKQYTPNSITCIWIKTKTKIENLIVFIRVIFHIYEAATYKKKHELLKRYYCQSDTQLVRILRIVL